MARNFAEESEYGLGVLPDTSGEAIAPGATGRAAIPAFTDADAVKAGAVGQEATVIGVGQLGHELRAIYATDPDVAAPIDPSVAAGTS